MLVADAVGLKCRRVGSRSSFHPINGRSVQCRRVPSGRQVRNRMSALSIPVRCARTLARSFSSPTSPYFFFPLLLTGELCPNSAELGTCSLQDRSGLFFFYWLSVERPLPWKMFRKRSHAFLFSCSRSLFCELIRFYIFFLSFSEGFTSLLGGWPNLDDGFCACTSVWGAWNVNSGIGRCNCLFFFSSLFPSFPLWHFRLCITAFFRSCGPALNVAVFEFSVVIFIVTFVSPGINSTFQRNLFVANRARELCLSVSTKLASAGEAFRLVRMTPKEDKHKKKNERTPTMAD